jgi:hypothetical protein
MQSAEFSAEVLRLCRIGGLTVLREVFVTSHLITN